MSYDVSFRFVRIDNEKSVRSLSSVISVNWEIRGALEA